MTKTAILKTMREIKQELNYLHAMEELYNPEWRFTATHYSKRRVRLVRTFHALKAIQRKEEVARHA